MNPHPLSLSLALLLASCAGSLDEAPAEQALNEAKREEEVGLMKLRSVPAGAAPAPAASVAFDEAEFAGVLAKDDKGGPDAEPAEGREAAEEPAVRAWFPETLLFEPLVVTDARGEASVDLRVPDSLTTWRVLALAHDRAGGQAGTTATFRSTMPLSLDVVPPPVLRVGDRLALPVQVVNQRDDAFAGTLRASVSGDAVTGGAGGAVVAAPGGTALGTVDLVAVRPGQAVVSVDLAGADRVERTLTVVPAGRPVEDTRSGTLAAPRSFPIRLPAGAAPGSSTLDLVVWPGPLGLLAAQAASPVPSDGAAGAGWAWAAAGAWRRLGEKMGAKPDPAALRRARLLAWQRLVRATRSPGPADAVVALAAVRADAADDLAGPLARRLAQQVAAAQSADGSFAGALAGGETLEQSVAFAAEAARVAGDLEPRVRRRAGLYVARHGESVREPWVAATVLAAGLADEPLAVRLREVVTGGVETLPDGSRRLPAAALVPRPDGVLPGAPEATARAVLALAGRQDAAPLVADLAASLLAAWHPRTGFGDGAANLVALDALALVYAEPLPKAVQVRMAVDGRQVLAATLDLGAGYAPLAARVPAPDGAGGHEVRIEAEPAVPGLAFRLTRTSWLPPVPPARDAAFTLEIESPSGLGVGERGACAVRAAVPGGEPFEVDLPLPAGVEADRASLEALHSSGAITGFHASEGRVVLHAPALPEGAAFSASFDVVPTLAGAFRWGVASLALAREPASRVEAALPALAVAAR